MFRKCCKQWLSDVATVKHLLNHKIECFRDIQMICPFMLTNVTAAADPIIEFYMTVYIINPACCLVLAWVTTVGY